MARWMFFFFFAYLNTCLSWFWPPHICIYIYTHIPVYIFFLSISLPPWLSKCLLHLCAWLLLSCFPANSIYSLLLLLPPLRGQLPLINSQPAGTQWTLPTSLPPRHSCFFYLIFLKSAPSACFSLQPANLWACIWRILFSETSVGWGSEEYWPLVYFSILQCQSAPDTITYILLSKDLQVGRMLRNTCIFFSVIFLFAFLPSF